MPPVSQAQPRPDFVLAELRDGAKHSHWIWFVFPQLRGLGRSPTAERFGISSLAEARAYLAHPVLGPRLRECTRLVTAIDGRSIDEIFGWPDNLKVRSTPKVAKPSAPSSTTKNGKSKKAIDAGCIN